MTMVRQDCAGCCNIFVLLQYYMHTTTHPTPHTLSALCIRIFAASTRLFCPHPVLTRSGTCSSNENSRSAGNSSSGWLCRYMLNRNCRYSGRALLNGTLAQVSRAYWSRARAASRSVLALCMTCASWCKGTCCSADRSQRFHSSRWGKSCLERNISATRGMPSACTQSLYWRAADSLAACVCPRHVRMKNQIKAMHCCRMGCCRLHRFITTLVSVVYCLDDDGDMLRTFIA